MGGSEDMILTPYDTDTNLILLTQTSNLMVPNVFILDFVQTLYQRNIAPLVIHMEIFPWLYNNSLRDSLNLDLTAPDVLDNDPTVPLDYERFCYGRCLSL